jgi:aryl-alcohol dehydrogenase-like predicted oxidoreductase
MQREIGATGLRVNPMGLGAMPLSLASRPDEAQALEVIKAFLDVGGDFIDTANVYCLDDADIGHNERLIRKALTQFGKWDKVLVATKGGLRRPKGAWTVDASPAWLRASCEKSLQDLNTHCITLYQLHAPDPRVPLADSLGEMARLQAEGKIRHIGLSNVNPAELNLALDVCPIASVQNRCNPFEKHDFRCGLVALCAERGVAYIPHSPVGGHFGHVRLPQNPVLRGLATKHQCSPHGIALAWLLGKGEHVFPIPGASKVASVRDSAQAVNIKLSPEDIAAIDNFPDA